MTESTKKLRVGVVGLGMGKHHIKSFLDHDRCVLAAVCDMDEDRLNWAKHEYDVPHVFTDAEAMFASGQVDAVAIVTPNFTHHPLVLSAVNHGLHILCEKPIALNARQGEEMIEAAKAKGVTFAMHFNHRMLPQVQTMRRHVDAGTAGELHFVRTVWHRRRGIPGGATGWFSQKAKSGGGGLIDLGVHMLDIALYLMGYPKVIAAMGSTHTLFAETDKPGMDVDDFATGYLRLEGGRSIEVEISWASHHEKNEERLVAAYGDKAGLVWRTPVEDGREVRILRREQDDLTDATVTRFSPNHATVQADFVDAVLDGREPKCKGEHGLTVMRILDALYESSETGHEVAIG